MDYHGSVAGRGAGLMPNEGREAPNESALIPPVFDWASGDDHCSIFSCYKDKQDEHQEDVRLAELPLYPLDPWLPEEMARFISDAISAWARTEVGERRWKELSAALDRWRDGGRIEIDRPDLNQGALFDFHAPYISATGEVVVFSLEEDEPAFQVCVVPGRMPELNATLAQFIVDALDAFVDGDDSGRWWRLEEQLRIRRAAGRYAEPVRPGMRP